MAIDHLVLRVGALLAIALHLISLLRHFRDVLFLAPDFV